MKRKINFSALSVKLLISAVFFGVAMCIINSVVSYREFKKQIEGLYGTVSVQFAETAISYIDPERIFVWLTDGTDGAWDSTNARLNELTETAGLAFIYVTVVSPDYKSRTFVFDTVHSEVLDTEVIPFGHVSSLEKKTPDYIEGLRRIKEEGATQSYYSYNKTGGHVTTSIPLRDYTGAVIAIVSVVKPMKEVAEYKSNYLKSLLFAALIFSVCFISLYTYLLMKGIVRPILLITEETSHFAEHHGELTGLLSKIKNRDELGVLAKSVEKMSVDMNRYISDLTTATAEKERLGAELNVATKIQAEMLPRVFPPYENHPEIELFATMSPAKEVGGDFYDFFMIDENHFAVSVADVSGKGVPAALFMVIAKTLLKDAAFRFKTPAEIFAHINDVLCEGNDSGLFVTCWMGILEISTGKMIFANAGHTLPVVLKKDGFSYLKTKPNLMLAAMQGVSYKNYEINLEKGDKIFIYTDGVTEATNIKNELYGENRLLSILNQEDTKSMNARDLLSKVRSDIDLFVDNAPQFDDITMLAMIVKEKLEKPQKHEMKISAEDKNIEKVNKFVHSWIPTDCEFSLLNKIDLAIEEIFINIAHYAYEPDSGDVLISVLFEDDELCVVFKDRGKEFNPLEKEDPDLTLNAEEREIGGLGIYLTKKFMDSVDYKYSDGQNILTIRKKITKNQGQF